MQRLLPRPGTDATPCGQFLPAGEAVTVITFTAAVGSLDSFQWDGHSYSSAEVTTGPT